MKKLTLIFILVISCIVTEAQVVINEISANPGNYEGQGGEWTELYNTSASPVNLSCYVLTDGDEIVVFPTGTYIPANGYLIVYNNSFFNCATCNWEPAIANLLDNVGTISSPDPDGVTSINVATCGCSNQTGCFSVTWENPLTDNGGDRIVLFDANANIKDAVYYGLGNNYAATNAAILESVYAVGPNTANKNIIGTAAGCNLPAANNYDIPALPTVAGTSNAIWKYIGATSTGCTSSKARSTNGGTTWIEDIWPTPAGNNANADYKITYSLNAAAAVDITSTDNIVINACTGATISFNGEVYDFNQVYNNNAGDVGNIEGGSARGGSHVVATGGLTFDNAWSEAAVSATGLSALSYPTTAAITSSTTFKIYIKENTQGAGNINANTTCIGAGAFIQGQGSSNDCYVLKTITVNIVPPITAATFTCANGLVKVTTTPALTTGLTYNLVNSVTPALNQTSINVVQSPACASAVTAVGSFCISSPPCPTIALNTSTTTASGNKCPGDIVSLCVDGATATNLQAGSSIEWYKGTTAAFDPYTTGSSIGSSPVNISYAVTGAPGGAGIAATCPYLSGILANACTAVEGPNEFLVFKNGSVALPVNGMAIDFPANTDFTVASTTDLTNAFSGTISLASLQPSTCPSLLVNVTNGGTIPANATFIVFPTSGLSVNYDFSSFCGLGTVYVIIGASATTAGTFSNTLGRATVFTSGLAGCGANSYSYTTANISSNVDGDYINFVGPDVPGVTVAGATLGTPNAGNFKSNNGCALPNILGNPIFTIPCYNYTIPASECNNAGNLFIKGVVKPIDPACAKAAATTASSQYTVTCPSAFITGQKAICAGASTSFDVTLANIGTNTTATIAYSINGVAQTPAVVSIVGNKVTVPNITTAGIVTITGATFSGGAAVCNASVSGDVTIIVNANPTAPTSAPVSVCAGKTTAVTALGGGPSYNWYSNVALTTLVATGNPYYYTGPTTTLYVQSIDPDNGCVSTGVSVAVTATTPPALVLPTSFDCATGNLIQTSTGGAGTVTYTLAGKTGNGGNAIGTNNTTGLFNLSNCTGATILVEDGSGCFDIVTYNFNAAPYNCGLVVALQFEQFEAQKTNKFATLNWKINDDVNIVNYVIERSNDGISFKQIGIIESKKLDVATYTFTDNNPASNKNYYRIKAVSNNGSVKYTQIKYVVFNNNFEINITPNPTNASVEVITNNNDKKEIIIMDAKGSVFYNQANSLSNIKVDCSAWPKGIYIIKVKDISTGNVVNKKIIKQ
jgi:hypothetical protein